MYYESSQGRKPLPFAMAEEIDNAVSAIKVCRKTLHVSLRIVCRSN